MITHRIVHHRAGRISLCAVALLALALAGCGSGDPGGAPALPSGFQPVKTGDFSFVVPDGWKIDVPGAADARRIELTVPAGGELAESRIVTVIALSDARTLVNVSIGVNADDPETPVDDMMGSLRVG